MLAAPSPARTSAVHPGDARERRLGVATASPCSSCAATLEADHRIADHLAILAGYIGLETGAVRRGRDMIPRSEVLLILQRIRAQVELIGRAHRSAMPSAPPADLSQSLGDICGLFQSILPPNIEVTQSFADSGALSGQQVLILAQIASEAMSNAIKHAFPGGRAGRITVTCRREPTALVLEIADDGVGLGGMAKSVHTSRQGVRLMAALAHQVGAAFSIRSNNPGVKVRLELPQPA